MQLGHNDLEHIAVFEQNRFRARAAEQLFQLGQYALHGDFREVFALQMHGARRSGLDVEIQHGGKAQGAQYAQRVLVKAHVGLAHAADDLIFEVLLAAHIVDQPRLLVPAQRVDGEIAPLHVLIEIAGEHHVVRMAAVLVFAVDAEGGDLDGLAVFDQRHRAVL